MSGRLRVGAGGGSSEASGTMATSARWRWVAMRLGSIFRPAFLREQSVPYQPGAGVCVVCEWQVCVAGNIVVGEV